MELYEEYGKLALKAPFNADLAKKIGDLPTARWDKLGRVWRFRSTPWIGNAIVDAAHTYGQIAASPDALTRLRAAVSAQSLISEFENETPRQVPGSTFAPWKNQHVGRRLLETIDSPYFDWEMGCGKSKGVLDYILSAGVETTLVVCPAIVVGVWQLEPFKHWEDHSKFVVAAPTEGKIADRVEVMTGIEEFAKEHRRRLIVVVNFEACLYEPLKSWLTERRWDLIVCDEAHRIGTPGSKITLYINGDLAARGRKRVCLSGTPIRGDPENLYAQCKFLDPGLFGTNAAQFRDAFIRRIQIGGEKVLDAQTGAVKTVGGWPKVVGYSDLDLLATKFGHLVYKVTKKSAGLNLPPVLDVVRIVKLPPKARKIYDDLERRVSNQLLEGIIPTPTALVQGLRLHQITSGFVPVETIDENELETTVIQEIHTAKRDALEDVFQEIADGEPIACFARFRKDLEAIHSTSKRLGREACEVSGKRHDISGKWQDGRDTVAAIQIQSGGIGIDLTRASFGVFYSVGRSFVDYAQARARLDRPGQTRPVTLVHLVCENTIDEAIYAGIERREDFAKLILDRFIRVASERAAA